jgi:hypothetical protein
MKKSAQLRTRREIADLIRFGSCSITLWQMKTLGLAPLSETLRKSQ